MTRCCWIAGVQWVAAIIHCALDASVSKFVISEFLRRLGTHFANDVSPFLTRCAIYSFTDLASVIDSLGRLLAVCVCHPSHNNTHDIIMHDTIR